MHLPNQIGDVNDFEADLAHSILGLRAATDVHDEVHQIWAKDENDVENVISQNLAPNNVDLHQQNDYKSHEEEMKTEISNTHHINKDVSAEPTQLKPSQNTWIQLEDNKIVNLNSSDRTPQIESPLTNFPPMQLNFTLRDKTPSPKESHTKIDKSDEEVDGNLEEESKQPDAADAPEIKVKTPTADQTLEESNKEQCCRVCLESEQNDEIGKLIIPCRCAGSMKWIHDECLKTWIVSRGKNIQNASCELCNMAFDMQFKYKAKFFPKIACKEGKKSFITCICLSIVFFGLLVVIIYIASNWNSQFGQSNASSPQENSFSFKLAIIVACSIISTLLAALVVIAARDAFWINEVKEWVFFSPDLSKARQSPHEEPGSEIFDDVSNQDPPENSRTAAEFTTTQIDPTTTQPIVTEMNREEAVMNRSTLDADMTNALNDTSQLKDLNCSRTSEAIPFNSNILFTTMIQNMAEEAEIEKQQPAMGRFLKKNYSTNTISNNAQEFHGVGEEVANEPKKMQSSKSALGILSQAEEIYKIKKVGSKMSTSQKGLSRNVSSNDFKLRGNEEMKNSHKSLIKDIPKEFLSNSRQNSQKVIEVIVGGDKTETLCRGKSDNNLLPKGRVFTLSAPMMNKNASHKIITVNQMNTLNKTSSSSSKLEVNQTKNL